MIGLKRSSTIGTVKLATCLNRTMIGLKPHCLVLKVANFARLNRTMIGLKRERACDCSVQSQFESNYDRIETNLTSLVHKM